MVNIRKLEAELWESADLLRAGSKLTSNQYCMPVLGLIFLRYAYSRFKMVETEILKDRPVRGGRVLPVEASDFASKSALFLPREAQYEYLVNLPADIASAGLANQSGHIMNSLGEVVNNAMELVEAQSEQLTGVLPKDYTIFSDELLAELLRIFNNSALDEVGGDVIGRIYEYFLNKFAKNIAQDDGVFFTPKSLVKMIVNVLEPSGGILLDPACGSGGMFVQTGDFVNHAGMNANSTMTFYGQEKVEYNAQLCLMNMAVHGLAGVIKSGDEANTFYHDAHNLNGCCDYVMANPPFNVDKVNAESTQSAGRLPFGMPSVNAKKEVGNGNYLWISYFHSYLNEHGRAGFVMASSATDSSGKDRDIRQKLVETGHVDVMVSVGNNFFYTKSLPCSLWFFDKGKREELQDKVLFIDARNYYTVVDRTLNEWSDWQLKNLNAIVWLYRGEPEKYHKLLKEYYAEISALLAELDDICRDIPVYTDDIYADLLTATPRLETIARDFAGHYSDLWTSGKAMFVCLNKVTCVRMYDLVQKYWAAEIEALKIQIKHATQQESQELERKLQWMQETEMAVVISQEQNEIQTFQKWGLDIKYHREKMEKRELDKEFKDPANPLRVVFVCAMWLTGFDVKCLSCLYLDKPLKAHTLMQTIARANRVAEGKSNGLIIDYIGIVKALRKALADYTANVNGNGGSDPTVDKEKLISRILETIAATEAFLDGYGFSLQTLINAKDFEKLALLQTAADAVSATIEEKKTFQTYAAELIRLMKYTNHEDIEPDIRKRYEAIAAIYGELKKKRRTVTNVDLMVEINHIISEYVQIEQATDGITLSRQFDISKIDFDLLRREFAKAKKKNLIMKDLQELIRVRLDAMLFNNPDRIKYHERYQEIIEDYNSQQDRANIEKTFDELMDLVQNMDQEERRYVREGFSSDEELSLYDMLFSENLSKQDIQKIKKVAVDLLQKVKSKIAELDHWTDKQETKATIDTLIRDTLWLELPECYDELRISEYRQRIYEYVYTRYKGVA